MDKNYMVFDGSKRFEFESFHSKVKECGLNKKNYTPVIKKNMEIMAELQDKLYAHNKDGILILFQAMDAAGKDGMIKHVMTGLNPQGTHVSSFKKPSIEELNHDYMWRCFKYLPQRGHIEIFNRSYYEDVLVSKVHNLPYKQNNLPARCLNDSIWKKRYRQICNFERYLYENGITVLKFFLNLSKEEQKKRFLERIDNQSKNWKFSSADIEERGYWENYQQVYMEAINETATEHAPWYVIPADAKWYARLSVSEFIVEVMEAIEPQYPQLPLEEVNKLQKCKEQLLKEV